MSRDHRSSFECDISTGKFAEIIVDEYYRSFFIETDYITISIMVKIGERDFFAIDITVVADHPSRSELASLVQKELNISIIIDN